MLAILAACHRLYLDKVLPEKRGAAALNDSYRQDERILEHPPVSLEDNKISVVQVGLRK